MTYRKAVQCCQAYNPNPTEGWDIEKGVMFMLITNSSKNEMLEREGYVITNILLEWSCCRISLIYGAVKCRNDNGSSL